MWRDEALILDILLAVKKVLKYTRSSNKSLFSENDILQDAVMRQLEIVGEASNKLSNKFIEQHPEIPWLEMIGMRNRLIHEYFRIDLDRVWNTVEKDIPKLYLLLKPLVSEEE